MRSSEKKEGGRERKTERRRVEEKRGRFGGGRARGGLRSRRDMQWLVRNQKKSKGYKSRGGDWGGGVEAKAKAS